MESATLGGIERGRIKEIVDADYIVDSLDRSGITSPPLSAINEASYEQGDMVLFVLFADGSGKIISKA